MAVVAVLLANFGCHRPEPTQNRSGPAALVCRAADPRALPISERERDRRAVDLWLRGLSEADHRRLAAALEDFADALELTGFGGEELLVDPPTTLILETLDALGPGLTAARALAAAGAGVAHDGVTVQLLAACPISSIAGCECATIPSLNVHGHTVPTQRPAQQWALWPVLGGMCVEEKGQRRQHVRSLLRARANSSDTAISLVVDPLEMRDETQERRIHSAATRVAKRLVRVAERNARIESLADALAAEPVGPPKWLTASRSCIWVLPKLSRLAGNPIASEVAGCLDAQRVEVGDR